MFHETVSAAATWRPHRVVDNEPVVFATAPAALQLGLMADAAASLPALHAAGAPPRVRLSRKTDQRGVPECCLRLGSSGTVAAARRRVG